MTVTKHIATRRTVIKRLSLDGEVLDRLEQLQIVIPIHRPGRERAYQTEDIDRLRVYQVLVQELGVNPEGAEIILRLREQLMSVRQRMAQVATEIKTQGLLDEIRTILDSIDTDW